MVEVHFIVIRGLSLMVSCLSGGAESLLNRSFIMSKRPLSVGFRLAWGAYT